MHIYDLVDQAELAYLHDERYVVEHFHPHEPLAILNYTDKAQTEPKIFADYPSLNYCRGLIYNTDSGEIVARPFAKFWNYGQAGAAFINMYDQVLVTDKLDGSLGILYTEPSSGQLAIATRGSFESEQAIKGTEILRKKYPDAPSVYTITPLFEIIYPENRIVLDYGDREDLILLGGVDINRGDVYGPRDFDAEWDGPTAQVFEYSTLAQALAAPDRDNAEGFVVRSLRTGGMVKIKQEDYVRLHRLVTGLSERRVWEQLIAGEELQAVLEPLPDEFHEWVSQVYRRIAGDAIRLEDEIRAEYFAIMQNVDWSAVPEDVRSEKKAFATEVQKVQSKHPWALYLLFAGRGHEIQQILLTKHLQPLPFMTPANGRAAF